MQVYLLMQVRYFARFTVDLPMDASPTVTLAQRALALTDCTLVCDDFEIRVANSVRQKSGNQKEVSVAVTLESRV